MKKVAVIQSNYIPWKGYFDIINDVDLFIFYDDVQYTKNDWRNRNKVKTAQGIQWLTIPVGSAHDRLICEVRLENNHWRKKHWATLQHAYSKTSFFDEYHDFFRNLYLDSDCTNLSEWNQNLIKIICKDFLGIKTEFHDSREFCAEGDKLDRLLDLLKKANADLYVSGPSAKNYIEEEIFTAVDIELVYKDYAGYPEYPQLFPPFDHAVSILDLIFNCGPNAPYYIWGWREA